MSENNEKFLEPVIILDPSLNNFDQISINPELKSIENKLFPPNPITVLSNSNRKLLTYLLTHFPKQRQNYL